MMNSVPFGRIFIISLGCLLCLPVVWGQETFKGVVKDASTGEPLEMVTIQLLWGQEGKLQNYTLTDSLGRFSLISKQTVSVDSLYLSASLFSYQKVLKPVVAGQVLTILLESKPFDLKEVEIRPGRIWGTRDTINYDVARFLSGKEVAIKDVIRKLPGVDVDDLGQITYNGRSISHFYVEGMDLADGRYNRITNNLQAEVVETVQILENHQPIRILQDKVKVEDVAINLKLKPEFRDKWMVSLKGGAGASAEKLLWEGGLNAMQLSRKSQSAYMYKGNNLGQDVAEEQAMLVWNASDRLEVPALPSFFAHPSFSSPLKKDRWLFNNAHSLSANRMYKVGETTQVRLHTGYTHDWQRQERGSETSYYQAQDTITLTEHSRAAVRSDLAEIGLSLEDNAANRFLVNKFTTLGNWTKSRAEITGTDLLSQQIRTSEAGLKNEFRTLWNREGNTLEARSLVHYYYLPSRLEIDNAKEVQNVNDLYTDNSLSLVHKKGEFTSQYTAGVTGQINSVQNGTTLYTLPSWQLSVYKWRGSFSLPVKWTTFPGRDFSRISLSPSLYIRYTCNYAWRFSFSGSYKESYGELLDLYTDPYRTDYRNVVYNEGSVPVRKYHHYAVYGEYKNTIREFFATASISYAYGRFNHIYEQSVEDSRIIRRSSQMKNSATTWAASGILSKGWYEYGLKASLDWRLSRHKAERLSKELRLPYESNQMQYEPKLIWSPSARWEAGYHTTFLYGASRIGSSTRLTPLWNIAQKLQLSYSFFPVDVAYSVEHYHNDVSRNKSVNMLLSTISFRWKIGGWQVNGGVANLFDKKQYGYTQYTSVESYTSWVKIRGREFYVSLRIPL